MMTITMMQRWLGPVVVPVVMMVALGTLVVADAASAQRPGGRGARAGRMGGRAGLSSGGQLMHLRALDLTEAQQEQIRSIHEQSGEATQAVDERLRVARQRLQHAVTANVVNEGDIRSLADALGTAEGDAAVQQAYLHAQVWQMLTPEQQVAAREAEAELARRTEQRRQHMGERRELRQQRRQQR